MGNIFCYFCGWDIGQITWKNERDMRKRYVNHILDNHDFPDIAWCAYWTTDQKAAIERAKK